MVLQRSDLLPRQFVQLVDYHHSPMVEAVGDVFIDVRLDETGELCSLRLRHDDLAVLVAVLPVLDVIQVKLRHREIVALYKGVDLETSTLTYARARQAV